ncbi:hypothetical protein [Delftia tsuruhatensis]
MPTIQAFVICQIGLIDLVTYAAADFMTNGATDDVSKDGTEQ